MTTGLNAAERELLCLDEERERRVRARDRRGRFWIDDNVSNLWDLDLAAARTREEREMICARAGSAVSDTRWAVRNGRGE